MNRYEEKELQQEMEQVEEYLSDYLRDPGYGGAVGNILHDMEMSKGKRLRPRLLLMASRFGKEQDPAGRERLCRLGALVELVHMASLIHDDIVDDAPLRRGFPTTQSKYGKDRAVYAGDLILSRIVQSLFRDGFFRVGALFGEAVESMCLGELGQMECRGREDVTVEQYMRNIYGKTAALCRLACLAGAVESGCSESVQAQLEQLGINFGRTVIGGAVWDLMRLADWLLALPDTDGFLACAGMSGGGQQTLWFAALDDRVCAAITSGYFYGVRDALIELPQNCACNYVPHFFETADMGELGALLAPRPFFVESGTNDPLSGKRRLANVTEQLDVTRAAYRLFDAEDRIEHSVHEGAHQWCGKGMQAFLRKALAEWSK